jgi:UDP-N-acetyl-2-amino-2-deoxyglucuronate dehydrogenase
MSKALRFAVVGCGSIGRWHTEVICDNDEAQVTALVDTAPERAVALADHVVDRGRPRPFTTTSLPEALARTDVDAVVVCTPSGAHAEVAVAALQSGRHVLIEKPIDVTLSKARAIADAAAAAPGNPIAAVIFQRRYDPASKAVHDAIQSGRFGRVTSAVASVPWWRSQHYYDSDEWRGTWQLDGGGTLINQSIHTLDLLVWLLGRPVEIYAQTGLFAHERIEVEDTMSATIRFESGAIATMHATTTAYPGLLAGVRVFGTKGSAIIDNDRLLYFHAAQDGAAMPDHGVAGSRNQAEAEVGPVESSPHVGDWALGPGHARQYADFIDAVRTHRQPMVTVEEATLDLAIARAVYWSASTGRPVLLEDVLAAADDVPGPVVSGTRS